MKPFIIKPGENVRIDVQQDLNSGVILIIRDSSLPAKSFRLSRNNAIGMAVAMMEGAGVPIQEALERKKSLEQSCGRA